MNRARRTLAEGGLLAVLIAVLAGTAAWQGWLWRVDQAIYDAGLALRGRPAPADIAIVAIDEESLARIGRWPWRRAVHATLVERLTAVGVRAVGLDLIFSEPEAGDDALAEAIRRNGRVVLPVVPQSFGPGLLAEGLPVAPLAAQAARLGHIDVAPDADGIVRAVHLWGGVGSARHPQLALAMLQLAEPEIARGHPRPAAAGSAGAWHRGDRLALPFAGPPGTYRTLSYVDVLTGAVPAEDLRGRLVLVGATAAGLGDVQPTPTSASGRPMPGVEVHATALDALRSGEAIVPAPAGLVVALTMAACLAVMAAHLLLSPRNGLLLSAVLTGATLLGAVLLLDFAGLWLPPAAILLGAALAYPLWSWRRLEAAQRFLDAELRQLEGSGKKSAVAGRRGVDLIDRRIGIVRAAAERQRAAQAAREQTLRFVSHDLRAPLASIVTVTEGEAEGDADCPARVQLAGRYAQKALDLADDLVRLGKAEALDPERFEATDLAALAEEAADEAWPLAERRQGRIDVDIGCRGEATVMADRALLRRALVNLLDNAVKYGPPAGVVRLAVADDGPAGYRLEVADAGPGIAPERLGDLFDRYRSGGDGRRGSGVGLGLVIVKTIVERHGGSVAAASEPGRGATFTVRLPATAAAPA